MNNRTKPMSPKAKYWIESKNVEVNLNGKSLIKDIDLRIKHKEHTVILGPNGAGKSTLLKLIDRTVYPIHKKGSYFRLFGSSNINIWDLRKKIGFLSKDVEERIPGSLSSVDVIISGIFGVFKRIDNEAIIEQYREKADKLLKTLRLDSIRNQSFGELSDGQKRLVTIIRALIHEPQVVILDEPTNSLDLASKKIIIESLDKLTCTDTTLVQVTHDISNIIQGTKRIVLMKKGSIVANGSPKQILKDEVLSELFDIKLHLLFAKNSLQVITK